jgi:hypothetical protein
MSEKLLTEMSYDGLGKLLNNYIDRSSQQGEAMPANTFFTLLFEKVAQRVKKTFEVEGRIINGQLVLSLPTQAATDLYVQNNQIVIGEQRIVVKLLA